MCFISARESRFDVRAIRFLYLLLVACSVTLAGPPQRLSFDDRVAAQEAIERVYYSYQRGTTTPFEEAISRTLLEKKVRTYLKQ